MKISSDRKKELQAEYKQMKTDMGILAIINKSSGRHFLEAASNLKGKLNSNRFQLNTGAHRHRELQKDWKLLGEDGFAITVLEKLDYDEDESKTDYSDELELLKLMWIEKLSKENVPLY